MENAQPLPTPAGEPVNQTTPQSPQSVPAGAASTPADALGRASAAVAAVVAQTSKNPAARMQAIIDIKATYIKEQFGIDITQ